MKHYLVTWQELRSPIAIHDWLFITARTPDEALEQWMTSFNCHVCEFNNPETFSAQVYEIPQLGLQQVYRPGPILAAFEGGYVDSTTSRVHDRNGLPRTIVKGE